MTLLNKARYLFWAATRMPGADRDCPACESNDTTLIKRKYVVTALCRCEHCRLMFRVPKTSDDQNRRFYQKDYHQGFTADCPPLDVLDRLKRTNFRHTAKDYTVYIDILRALGLEPGQSIFDFGSSWGYGSWQLARAGFRVYSYEISSPRARYSAEQLGCDVRPADRLPEKVDCFFSAHVIEHLLNPRTLWNVASSVLKPSGVVALFTPNGDPSLAATTKTYHQLWGQVHPLLLTAESLSIMAADYGFRTIAYSVPYDLDQISSGSAGYLSGDELLVVARHNQLGHVPPPKERAIRVLEED